jgi:hypothetical protein
LLAGLISFPFIDAGGLGVAAPESIGERIRKTAYILQNEINQNPEIRPLRAGARKPGTEAKKSSIEKRFKGLVRTSALYKTGLA